MSILPNEKKVQPQAIDIEMAVLGSMLIDNGTILKTLDLLATEDFYNEIHKLIFSSIYELYLIKNKPVDILTIYNVLQNKELFVNAGGISYLTKLTDTVQTVANVESYITIIKEKAILRKIIKAGYSIISDAFHEERSAGEILNEAQAVLFNIFSQHKNNTKHDGCINISGLIQPLLKEIEHLHLNPNEISGLSTGFKDLDNKTTGLHPAELIIIAARPSMGKTALALNIAEYVALHEKKPVCIFSLETTRSMLILRMLSSLARVNGWNLRNGQCNDNDLKKLHKAANEIASSPIFIDDNSNITIMEIEIRARELANELYKNNTPLALIIIDYIQFIRSKQQRFESRQQEVADISRALKSLAKDLNVPVIALSQLSRKTEDRSNRKDNKPQLADLRDSGAIEQDADLVMMLYREGYYNRDDTALNNKALLMIAKQRNGPIADIPLVFEGEYTKFSSKYIMQED
ncbi:MAG: replicative DNA helicase [Endomicrobium sp.]|jgi:replicative DNA helicase|nr:replicative DNA helicase [Endomicrobium sp.]